jgi:hypothetical protein
MPDVKPGKGKGKIRSRVCEGKGKIRWFGLLHRKQDPFLIQI